MAPTDRAHALTINYALADQVIHPGDHVPVIAHSKIADVKGSELLAIPRRASIVWTENQCSLCGEHLDRVIAIRPNDWRIDTRRSAVNYNQQRVFLSWIKPSRLN